jgi:osmotically-inducible protein OsmY
MPNNKELELAVLEELSWEPSVDSAHVGVRANAGVVILSGHVGSFIEKYSAERAALRVKGVKAVAEEIEVRLPSGIKHTDEERAAAALDRISWNVSVPRDAIKVKVEKGWVTITGKVYWRYQRDFAVQDVRGLRGVFGVTDEITIKPQVNASNLSHEIMRALHRSWCFEPKTITVTAHDGKVRLTGTVSYWHYRELAELAAWAAPGATAVQNDIIVV